MDAINIGKRLEVFWDNTMIDHHNTGTIATLHQAVQRECVLKLDEPWGSDCGAYLTVLQDKDVYRLYFSTEGRILYAESKDGINWYKPIIGEYDFNGSKENNILSVIDANTGKEAGLDGFRPFIDTNPDCKPDERYKVAADLNRDGKARLILFTSPDGVHFTDKGILNIRGSSFDSMNTVYYNPVRKKYQTYIRDFHSLPNPENLTWIRDIRFAETDHLEDKWPDAQMISYDPAIDWQMYINSVLLYPRAEHIYIGFPSRYMDRKWTPNHYDICGMPQRREHFENKNGNPRFSDPRYATAMSDTLFMTSRDGLHWRRYADTFLTPGPEHPTNWNYGSVYFSNGIVETKSLHPGCDNELSFYCAENRWSDKPAEIYRYSLRMDGFVSQRAPWYGTNLRTKRLIFDGSEMFINFSTSVYGGVTVTIRDDDGNQIKSIEMFGDSTNRKVRFEQGNLADFAGKPVTVDFAMRDADLYSMRFN